MRYSTRIALATLAIAVVGCGGGSDTTASVPTITAPTGAPAVPTAPKPAGPTDAKQIRKAIDAVLAGGSPAAACGTAVTPAYVKRIYGDAKTCAQSQGPGSAAKSVKISAVKIAGTSATAVAVPSGGPSDGEKITITLVKQGGTWKLDSQHSNAPVGP